MPDPAAGVGLLVLSATHTVLLTNEEAAALRSRLRTLHTPDDPTAVDERALPTSVQRVCEEVERALADRSERNDWHPSSSLARSDMRARHGMQASVFPSRASLPQTRILVTLQSLELAAGAARAGFLLDRSEPAC